MDPDQASESRFPGQMKAGLLVFNQHLRPLLYAFLLVRSSRTTRLGFTSATSWAINPNCGVPVFVGFVLEYHRFDRHNSFAGITHRFNLRLEPLRRTHRTELTCRVDHYR